VFFVFLEEDTPINNDWV